MKFIRMATHTEEFYKSPPANFGELLKEHKHWLEKQKRSGKLLAAYLLAGNADGDRNVFIWDFESTDEIDKAIWEDPIGFTFNWEVYPAVDVFEHIDNVLPYFSSNG
ncbi:MAG: hypothetical protein LBJ91_03645 [Clostridiales Family XIII bacterium]|nr:hypothetical protein [Clostridiales Family XIII bacterium]